MRRGSPRPRSTGTPVARWAAATRAGPRPSCGCWWPSAAVLPVPSSPGSGWLASPMRPELDSWYAARSVRCRARRAVMKWLASLVAVVAFVAPGRPARGDTLDEIVKADWQGGLPAVPQLATNLGVHDYDDRLARVDEVAQQQTLAHFRDVAKKVAALDVDKLSTEDRVTARVLAEQARARIAEIELHEYLMPMNGDSSFYSNL